MVDFIITDFESVRGGGNIVDTVPSAEDFIVNNCTISSSSSSGEFVLTPGESLVGNVWLSANPTSITVGQSVVFSAFVEDTDGEPLEGLTVSFYRDGVSLGGGVSDDSGLVQLTVSSWSVGSFTCTASCQGVSSSGVTVTVSKITSTISLSAVSSTITVGQAPQLTGTLSVGSGESVKIYLGDVLVDTVTTGTNGAFSFTGSATSTSGSLTFKAVYDGDSTHSSVTSSNVVITVTSAPVVDSVSLTADKSVLSAYDSESAVLSATVLDQSSNPMSGETVTFYKGSTSIGTATTNSSGIATKSYSATGAGDVTFKASVGMIVSETYSITDSIIYRSSEISKSNKNSTAKNEVIINDIGVDLADMNFEFSFDGKFTGTDGILCIGYSNSVGQYRVHIGAEEDTNRSLNWGYRTTTTTSSNGSGRIENQWYNMKIIRNGTNFDYYIDNVKVDTKTTNFMSSYHTWALYIQLWKNNSSVTVKNLKLKPL